jgi:uncharacterized protein YggU (UPF0235/DUF167 family)
VIRFSVHVTPGVRHARAGGTYGDALRVRVGAHNQDGAANGDLVDCLARSFGVKSSAVRIVVGFRSRTKIVELEGDHKVLNRRLVALMADQRP